jgi:hypothetical protein
MSSSKSRVGKLTYADYERIPDDGLRHEIIDGDHWVSRRRTSTIRRSPCVSRSSSTGRSRRPVWVGSSAYRWM